MAAPIAADHQSIPLSLSELPEDMSTETLSYLSPRSRAVFSSTSKKQRELSALSLQSQLTTLKNFLDALLDNGFIQHDGIRQELLARRESLEKALSVIEHADKAQSVVEATKLFKEGLCFFKAHEKALIAHELSKKSDDELGLLSKFRIGEFQAIWGMRKVARDYLQKASSADGVLPEFATIFPDENLLKFTLQIGDYFSIDSFKNPFLEESCALYATDYVHLRYQENARAKKMVRIRDFIGTIFISEFRAGWEDCPTDVSVDLKLLEALERLVNYLDYEALASNFPGGWYTAESQKRGMMVSVVKAYLNIRDSSLDSTSPKLAKIDRIVETYEIDHPVILQAILTQYIRRKNNEKEEIYKKRVDAVLGDRRLSNNQIYAMVNAYIYTGRFDDAIAATEQILNDEGDKVHCLGKILEGLICRVREAQRSGNNQNSPYTSIINKLLAEKTTILEAYQDELNREILAELMNDLETMISSPAHSTSQ